MTTNPSYSLSPSSSLFTRAMKRSVVLAVRGLLVVALGAVILMTRLWPGIVE